MAQTAIFTFLLLYGVKYLSAYKLKMSSWKIFAIVKWGCLPVIVRTWVLSYHCFKNHTKCSSSAPHSSAIDDVLDIFVSLRLAAESALVPMTRMGIWFPAKVSGSNSFLTMNYWHIPWAQTNVGYKSFANPLNYTSNFLIFISLSDKSHFPQYLDKMLI